MACDSIFWAVFDAVTGFGAALIVLVVVASLLGFEFGGDK